MLEGDTGLPSKTKAGKHTNFSKRFENQNKK